MNDTIKHIIFYCKKNNLYIKYRKILIDNINNIYMDNDIELDINNKDALLKCILFPNNDNKFIKLKIWIEVLNEFIKFIKNIKYKF